MRGRKKPWYLKEEPQTERAGPIFVRSFRRAKRLQFSSTRTDPRTGLERAGLTFTLHRADLESNPAAAKLVERFARRASGSEGNWFDEGCNAK